MDKMGVEKKNPGGFPLKFRGEFWVTLRVSHKGNRYAVTHWFNSPGPYDLDAAKILISNHKLKALSDLERIDDFTLNAFYDNRSSSVMGYAPTGKRIDKDLIPISHKRRALKGYFKQTGLLAA